MRMIVKRVKKILYILLFVFVVASWLFIQPTKLTQRTYYRSSQLQKIVSKDNDTERTDYIDSEGRLTIAADAGYATMIKMKTEQGIMEQYYDDNGEPISRYSQYYAVIREYDDHGNNITIIYLGQDGNPCLIRDGYAIEARVYNDSNQILTVRYYDSAGNPVCTPAYGYGKINEYDENGYNIRTCFADLFGNPMMTGQGYASVVRQYYLDDGPDRGRIESEFYYDDLGRPIALSLGQYGIHKEYNELGQGSVIIYLDAEGKPSITNNGFTKVVRTFSADNNVATEMYYDMDGNPVSLSEGQYGIEKENGQTMYLDKNGKRVFNLRNLLYNHSRLVLVFSLTVIILSALLNKKWNIAFLMLYICVIIYFTLMFRDDNGEKRIGLFWYFRRFFSSSTARSDIIKNVWLFIPLGAILYQLNSNKIVLLIPIAISVIIEGIQYATGIGFCELDDIISNSIGGGLGFLTGKLTRDCVLHINTRKQANF